MPASAVCAVALCASRHSGSFTCSIARENSAQGFGGFDMIAQCAHKPRVLWHMAAARLTQLAACVLYARIDCWLCRRYLVKILRRVFLSPVQQGQV